MLAAGGGCSTYTQRMLKCRVAMLECKGAMLRRAGKMLRLHFVDARQGQELFSILFRPSRFSRIFRLLTLSLFIPLLIKLGFFLKGFPRKSTHLECVEPISHGGGH